MVGIGCKRFLRLFIIFMVFMPVTFAFAAIEFSTENTIYRASSCGIVFLESPYSATSFTFSDGFLMFSGFNYGSENWGSIGFSCQTENANMTVNVVRNNYLKYTVDAPTSTISITKIYLGNNRRRPTDVIGATSWGYNAVNKILTVSITHNSPQEIELEWGNNFEKEWVNTLLLPAMGFSSLIILVAIAVMVMNSFSGVIDPTMIKDILLFVVSIILAVVIVVRMI